MCLSWLKSGSLLSQNSWFIVSLCLFFSQLHPVAGSPWWKMVACKLGYYMISCPYPWRGSMTLCQLNRILGPVFIICLSLTQSVAKVNQSLVSKYNSQSSHLELAIGAAWWLQWQRGMKWVPRGYRVGHGYRFCLEVLHLLLNVLSASFVKGWGCLFFLLLWLSCFDL